jgi:demethylmenaquinone methyltransferase/2-methoxy-6-polyprenyl-1,4-benzoquinol methylase
VLTISIQIYLCPVLIFAHGRQRISKQAVFLPDFQVVIGSNSRNSLPTAAHVAELADAHGSGPCGATLGGSNPLVSNLFRKKYIVDETLAQTDPEFVKKTFASIAGRYDFTNHLLSGGMDWLWRRQLAHLVAQRQPKDILDLATGSGDLALAIAKVCPAARVMAADFCLPMLEMARRKRVPNLIQADGLALPFCDESFDVVTVAFGLRNMADWGAAIREAHRVLRGGGAFFVMDFSLPDSAFLLKLHRFYLHRVLPRLAQWATQRRDAYEYLGTSIESFPSGLAMNSLLKASGFKCEPPRQLAFGAVSIYCGCVVG